MVVLASPSLIGMTVHLTAARMRGRIGHWVVARTLAAGLLGHVLGGVGTAMLVAGTGFGADERMRTSAVAAAQAKVSSDTITLVARALLCAVIMGASAAACTQVSRAGAVALTVLSGATFRALATLSCVGDIYVLSLAMLLQGPSGMLRLADMVRFVAMVAAANVAGAAAIAFLLGPLPFSAAGASAAAPSSPIQPAKIPSNNKKDK